jgi:hypothetical protein
MSDEKDKFQFSDSTAVDVDGRPLRGKREVKQTVMGQPVLRPQAVPLAELSQLAHRIGMTTTMSARPPLTCPRWV